MTIKEKLFIGVSIAASIVGLLATFYSVKDLMLFLSEPNFQTKQSGPVSGNPLLTLSWSLFANMSLLTLFILQHSLLALPAVKQVFAVYDVQVLERTVYVITTGFVLQVLIGNWQCIPEVVLWKFNFSRALWWIFVTVHAFAWLLIYSGNICMDINELLGLKQVYYRIRNFPEPSVYKSNELKRLNHHMRHPSFLAFTLLLWVIPVMSLDRLLLATILTVYMYLAWNTDRLDYHYQESQHVRKFHELERL